MANFISPTSQPRNVMTPNQSERTFPPVGTSPGKPTWAPLPYPNGNYVVRIAKPIGDHLHKCRIRRAVSSGLIGRAAHCDGCPACLLIA